MTLSALQEKMPPSEGAFDPCFAFSVHKCGSTLMHAMLDAATRRAGIPAVTVPDIMFNLGELGNEWQRDPAYLPIFTRQLLYYGFRSFPAVLAQPDVALMTRRFVLLVRDPRDALVSQYFSFGRKKSSHAVPKENPDAFLKQIEGIRETEIDTYVLAEAPHLARKLTEYRSHLNFDLGLLRRYEDIYFDKRTFLADIFIHFGIDVPPAIIDEVAAAHDIRPEAEDDSKHIRKGTPGDHREKLAPSTIEKLNDTFREIGSFYGYAL